MSEKILQVNQRRVVKNKRLKRPQRPTPIHNHNHHITKKFFEDFQNNRFNQKIKTTISHQNRFHHEGPNYIKKKPKITKKQNKQLNQFLNLGSGLGGGTNHGYSKRHEQETLRKLLSDEGEDSVHVTLKGDKSLASQLQSIKQAHPELVHLPASKTMKMAVAAAGGRFRLNSNKSEKSSNSLLYSPFNGVPGSIVQQIPSNPNVVNYPGKQYPIGREKLSPRSAALRSDSKFTVVCEKCGKLVHGYSNFQEHQQQHSQVSKRYQLNKQYIARKREHLGSLMKLPDGQRQQRNEYDVNADDLLVEQRLESQLSIQNVQRKLKAREFEEAYNDLKTLIHQRNDVYAMVEMGNMYLRGCHVEESAHQAYHYYKMACDQDTIITKSMLGDVIDAILVVTSRSWDTLEHSVRTKAFRVLQSHAYDIKCDWFKQSQAAASSPTQHPSQAHHQNTKPKKKSPATKKKKQSSSHSTRSKSSRSTPPKHQHLRLLSHHGYGDLPEVHVERVTHETAIIYFYALCLLRGLGCEVDEAEGLKMIRKNAAKGHPPSLLLLARAHRDGSYGLAIQHNQAIKLLKQVITYEYPAACNVMGAMYEAGQGVETSIDMAMRLYQQGLFMGSPASQQLIAHLQEEDHPKKKKK